MLMVLPSAAIRHVWDHTEVGDAGWCMSVVCETRFDWNDIILWRRKPVKKETETTLFTTEATQQKEHTTHNLYIFNCIYSSVAISVHCWCSMPHRCSQLAGLYCSSLLCRFLLATHIVANCEDVLRMRGEDPCYWHRGRQMFGMPRRRGIQDPPFQGISRYETRGRSLNCGRLYES